MIIELSYRMFCIFKGIHDAFYSYLSEYVIKQRLPIFLGMEDKEHRVASSHPELIVNNMSSKLINHINGYLAEISDHKFYKWLQDSNLDPKLKLKSFIPLWIADIMGYRDINKYVFTYESPASESESIINEYAMYLTEHSRLFYTDWKSLELDDMLRWTASDTLEFIFLNTDMDVHRENIIKFSLCGLKYKDPLIRFWFILILELSGKEFFSRVGETALQVEKKYLISLPYLSGRHSTVAENNAYNKMYTHFFKKEIDYKQSELIIQLTDMVMLSLLNNLDISYRYVINNKLAAR
ncbi:TPA: hypothetical protein ACNCVR_004376 [Escherichia coli]|nr:hypothetical protein [Escherichia coli]EEW3622770.1 hypothetical protein [Escherichia coli]EFF9605492.1 hypothetical protein [Escherichia coli]EGJ7040456.1 hypothetical protein [Escherichia coli]